MSAGVVRVWQLDKAREVFVQTNSQVAASADQGGLAVIGLLFNVESNTLAVVSVDHNIILHHLDTFKCDRLVS